MKQRLSNLRVSIFVGAIVIVSLTAAPNLYGFIMFGERYIEHLHGAALGHALLNTLGNAIVALWAVRITGRVDRKLASVLSRVVLTHGTIAFAVLTLRLSYSNQVMFAALVVSIFVGVAVVIATESLKSTRVAVISTEASMAALPAGWSHISSPDTDLRPYDQILTGSLTELSAEWAEAVSKAMIGGKTVRHLAEFQEEQQGITSIDHFDIDHLPVAGLTSYGARKRLMDIVLVILSLPIALPILGLGALVVLITMGRPVIFVQSRAGLGGEMFDIYKLRTMRLPSSDDGHSATVAGDSRVTRAGRWLRRTRIDELPQLWNVLKGDMSIIGPRPEWAPLSQQYGEVLPTYKYRNLVRPGITGWAQNLGGYASNVEQTKVKLGYDLFYVKNMSLGLDLQIMLRTIWTVLSGYGSR